MYLKFSGTFSFEKFLVRVIFGAVSLGVHTAVWAPWLAPDQKGKTGTELQLCKCHR